MADFCLSDRCVESLFYCFCCCCWQRFCYFTYGVARDPIAVRFWHIGIFVAGKVVGLCKAGRVVGFLKSAVYGFKICGSGSMLY